MKKGRTKYLIVAVLLVITGMVGLAQNKPDENVKSLIEKTSLVTDREIYCVDERIHFSAFNLSSAELKAVEWSNILYVEMVSPDGQVIARRKFAYGANGSAGSLLIPSGVLTGNYYLRAYTRWMRDFSPYAYYYKLITIINPYRPELLEPEATDVTSVVRDTADVGVNGDLQIQTDKSLYKSNENVELTINFSKNVGSAAKYSVAVVPLGAEAELHSNLNKENGASYIPNFIPETRGLSISGKIVNQTDTVPIPYTLVGLTIFKDKPETRNVRTDEHGKFFFDLSMQQGDFEIFISAKAPDGKSPLILVDNDFSTDAVKLPFVPVDMSIKSKELYQSLSFISQLQKLYRQQQIEKEIKSNVSDTLFYGKPDFTLKLADFVSLPSIKEYFYELVPSVRLKHDGKRNTLKVLGPYSELLVYEPLVLVDMVPIFDIDKILEVLPEKIERIEVVTSPYVRGDIIFGGIISLFSKKADLAGIDLPSTGRFINYSMLNNGKTELDKVVVGSHIPNVSNCLYWNPEIKPGLGEKNKISFSTGDNFGKFIVVVKGFKSNGNESTTRHLITVE